MQDKSKAQASHGTSFAAVADETAKKRKEAQQKVNKAISQANRRRHRADQRTGALVMGIPEEIRGRVLAVVDAIVDDEKKLEACERVIRDKAPRGWDKIETSVEPIAEAAE